MANVQPKINSINERAEQDNPGARSMLAISIP